jgi:hypothetical protein
LIQSLKKEDMKNLEKFYDQTYGSLHILKNNLHIKWQFKKNPFLKKDKTSIIVYKHNNKIISHLGFIPVKLKFFNSIKKGVWHVSFFTLNEFRGKGLGLKLVKFSNKSFDFAMVLSGSEGTENIYHHIGGHTMGNLKRHINILEKEKVEKYLKKKISFQRKITKTEKKYKLKRIKLLNSRYDKFWNDVRERYPITTERTRKYMTWRFLKHPLVDYHFLVLENEKNIIGFSIIRFENKNKKIKAARIVDLIVKKEFEDELISSILDYCKKKCHFVDFFCTGNFYSTALKKFGFFNNRYKKLKIPTVFNPIDTNRRSEINFLYADLLKSTKNDILANENNWYLVKSDSDQDRAY